MAVQPSIPQSVRVGLKPAQTNQDVEAVVSWILNRGGCLACGRIAMLQLGFQEVISPELQKAGAISVQEQLAR